MNLTKGYLGRIDWGKKLEKDKYTFVATAAEAGLYLSRLEAERACADRRASNVTLELRSGSTYPISDFQVEELAPDKFVIYCYGPFELC